VKTQTREMDFKLSNWFVKTRTREMDFKLSNWFVKTQTREMGNKMALLKNFNCHHHYETIIKKI